MPIQKGFIPPHPQSNTPPDEPDVNVPGGDPPSPHHWDQEKKEDAAKRLNDPRFTAEEGDCWHVVELAVKGGDAGYTEQNLLQGLVQAGNVLGYMIVNIPKPSPAPKPVAKGKWDVITPEDAAAAPPPAVIVNPPPATFVPPSLD
jgi:hypothetical protein